MEPTSADPDALGAYVEVGRRLSNDLFERLAHVGAVRSGVLAATSEFAVTSSAFERAQQLVAEWGWSQSFVAEVRDALLAADGDIPGLVLLVRPSGDLVALQARLEADMVAGGADATLAKQLAADVGRLLAADPSLTVHAAMMTASAEHLGMSAAEFRQRSRAYSLDRSEVAEILEEHVDALGDNLTIDDLGRAVEDSSLPRQVRDAAYRVAADSGLFNDLDVASQTDELTAMGFDWSHADGVISRDDVAAFLAKDELIRTVLPWRIFIDGKGHLDAANGDIRPDEIAAFLNNPLAPPEVRKALWEFYNIADPGFADDPSPDWPAWGLVGPVTRPTVRPTPTAAGGNVATAAAALVTVLAAEHVGDRISDAYHDFHAPGAGGIRVFDHNGRPVDISLETLRSYPPERLHQVIAWASASGEPPSDVDLVLIPPEAVFLNGRWVDNETGEPVELRDTYLDDKGIRRFRDTDDELPQEASDHLIRQRQSGSRPDPATYPDPRQQRAIELENLSADRWTVAGHEVAFVDDRSSSPAPLNSRGETPPNPSRRPDHLVDGEFRDTYAPRVEDPFDILRQALRKVSDGQTQRVDIVLDAERTSVVVGQLIEQFETLRSDIESYAYVDRRSGERFHVEQVSVLDPTSGERIDIYVRGS